MALFFLSNHVFRNSFLSLTIDFNNDQFNRTMNLFEKLFEPIINLEPYDKIGIDENKMDISDKDYRFINASKLDFTLYLDKYKVYQSISRWYYKQKRGFIFTKLDVLFEEYFKFIEKIKDIEKNSLIKYNGVVSRYKELNSKLVTKLLILKTTYSDEEINNKIDSYCKNLEVINVKLEGIKTIPEENNETKEID